MGCCGIIGDAGLDNGHSLCLHISPPSPLLLRGRKRRIGNKGREGGEINGVQRWAELGAMKIAEGAERRKGSLMWKTKEGKIGCALWIVAFLFRLQLICERLPLIQ